MVNDSNIITINSTESKMKINKFSGNYRQATRSGKNKLLCTENNYTKNGVTVTNTGNKITVKGTATARFSISIYSKDDNLGKLDVELNKTYIETVITDGTFNGNIELNIANSINNYYSQVKPQSNQTKSVEKLYDSEITRIFLWISDGATLDCTFSIQIEEGTEFTSFEEYGVSPSIDYPSEIETVGDNINIFDGEILINKGYGISTGILENNTGMFCNETPIKIDSSKKISISKDGMSFSARFFFYDNDMTFISSQTNIENEIVSIPENCYYINFQAGKITVNENYENIKIEQSDTITPYSPYNQGCVEIKKINKNWAEIDTPRTVERGGLSITLDDEGVFTINGTATSNIYMNLINIQEYQSATLTNYKLPLKNYKAYFDLISKNNSAVSESNGDTSFHIRNFASSSTGEQATTYCAFSRLITGNIGVQIKDCNITENRVVAYLYVSNGVKLDNFKFRFALYNEDETDTTYEKHEEQSYILPIQQEMLQGDYFVKEDDGWKEVHGFDYINTKNAETLEVNLSTSTPQAEGFYRYNINLGLNNRKSGWDLKLICTHFENANVRWNTTLDGICGWENGYNLCIGTHDENYNTTESMKTFLQNNDVGIYYELATPTKLACTSEQITVLNELQNILLYDDTTHIMLDDVYPILDYDVSKIVDTTMTFEASLDENGYFVVPDYNIKCLVSYSESNIPTMPEAVESTVRVAGKDGDVVLGTTYEPIAFTIVCYTDDNLSVEEKNAEELKMNNFLNSIKDKTIRLKLDSKNIFYNVKYNGLLTTINYPKHLRFSIPLKTSASFANNIEKSYMLGNATKQSNTAKKVGAIFTIAGPAQTPKIYLNDYEMFYNNVILSGAKLIIDSNRSTVTMVGRDGNLTNAMRYYNHEFPKIENGENVLKVSSGIDEDRQVSVEWFDLKL